MNELSAAWRVGTASDSFKYDPFGRRIYKSSSSGTSIFAYDGDNLVEETTAAGTVVARYAQTQNTDEPLAMLRSSATSYYHADGLGSITSLANGAGALTQTYTFDSFGKQTASSGSLTNPFQYTARESDMETGLYYYRARYYDPQIGRFLGEDPLRFNSGVNFYEYAFSNPVRFTDPLGLDVTITLWPGAHGYGHVDVAVNSNDTIGFYPSDQKVCLVLGCSVPGLLLNDQAQHPGIRPKIVVLRTTPEQDQAMQQIINQRRNNQGDYSLFGRNCARLVEDVLRAAGLQPLDTIYPRDLFRSLQNIPYAPGFSQYPTEGYT